MSKRICYKLFLFYKRRPTVLVYQRLKYSKFNAKNIEKKSNRQNKIEKI